MTDAQINDITKAVEGLSHKYAAAIDQVKDRMDTLETWLRRSRTNGGPDGMHDDETKYAQVFSEIIGKDVSPSELRDTRAAQTKYLRYGIDHLAEDERALLRSTKALSVGVEADGGYWAVPQMLGRIVARQFETSPMRQVAGVIETTKDAIELVNDTNDATSGGWVGETAARAETATPQIGKVTIAVHEHFANPRATQKLLDDSGIDVEQWLANKIADKLGREENTAFVTGNGVDRPRGFLDYSGAAVTTDDASRDWGLLQYVVTGKSAAFDDTTVDKTANPADELIDLVGKLNPAYRQGAVWLMNRATEASVRKIRDGNGDYITTMNTGNITGGALGSFNLLGFPIVNAEDMPAIAANSFSVAFGNFREGYQIVDRQGVRVLRDPYSAKPFVQFYTTKRVGGDVVNFDAIKLLKFGVS